MPNYTTDARVAKVAHLMDEQRLLNIQKQPGILAVLAFYEGFPLFSAGNGDFEQIAAIAEDFLRAGKKITQDMRMGTLGQITLEAGEKKCIIVPHGDLSLCLVTQSDINLGMVRLAIRTLQKADR